MLHHPRRARVTDLSCDRSPDGSQHAFTSGRSFHPLSAPLQDGIRFFHHPLPTTTSDDLAGVLVRHTGQTSSWAYRVPHKQQSWEGPVISPVIIKSACPHQANGQPITCPFGRARYCKLRLARSSFTTFINGSLSLTDQLSLAPHSGATPEITPDPSRDMAYPARWLHCQSAQYPTVTSDAPLLGYRGLNPWISHPWRDADQLLVQPSLHRLNRTKPVQSWAAFNDPGPVDLGFGVPSRPGTYATRVARLGS